MEMGERVLEGGHTHWNPGIGPVSSVSVPQQGPQQQQSDVVWPPMQSTECLLNTTTGSDVSMFGGYPLILSSDVAQHRLADFRHRFPPSMHFASSPSVVGGIDHHSHHDNLSSLNLPSHPLGEVSEGEGNSVQIQDGNSLGLEMESGHHGLDSEDCSDDDEDDEDEESDDDGMHIEGSGYVHHNQSMSLNVDQENPLPSCQQQQHVRQQLRVINSNGDLNMMGSNMDEHQKNGMMSHVHEIEEDIPPINQGHPLNSNPISAIPMITGNCSSMMMSDEQEVIVGGNSTAQANNDPSLSMNMGMNGDPSSCSSNGQSVHGKMYVEERVVFHLKQWTDSGFGHFNSCREQEQHKNQYRCSVCHIRSPHNNIPQKDTHRHLVRGILFSFEDCIILELYPEDYTDGQQEPRSDHPMSMDPKQIIHMEGTKADEESVPLSYFNPSSSSITNIVLPEHEPHSLGKPSAIVHDHNADQGWWDYETERDVVDRHDNIAHHVVSSSEACTINLKISAQQFHDAQVAATERDDTEMDDVVQIEIQQQDDNDSDLNNENDQDKDFQNYEESKYHDDSVPPPQYYANANTSETQQLPTTMSNSNNNAHHQCNSNSGDGMLPSNDLTSVDDVPISPESVGDMDGGGEANCRDTEMPPSSLADDLNREDDASNYEQKMTKSRLKKPVTKKKHSHSSNKYSCPCCNTYFNLKRLLKDHLEETHHDGNPFQCQLCKMQYADTKRLQRHSCTLSVESVKHRLKIKEIKLEKSEDKSSDSLFNHGGTNSSTATNTTTDSNMGSVEMSSIDGDSEILELVMTSKSSKIRKFSEKASLKTNKSPPFVAVHSITTKANTCEDLTKTDKPPDLLVGCEDEENDASSSNSNSSNEDRGSRPNNKSSSSKLNSTPPIKINQDQNLSQQQSSSNNKERKSLKSKEFSCKVCGKCFSQSRSLINHGACHKIEKRSQCEKCGKSFQRRDKLMRHMYVHSEEKMFPCEICDKKFSRRDKLSDHLKSHQTDEIYNCDQCCRQFLRPDILKQHVKMHQMEDKHQCTECLRFVTGKERLDQHMKRHEEAKALGQTLLCPLCTKYFIQTQSLKAHIRKFHRDALSQLNLHQLHFGCDEKEFAQNNPDNNRNTESPSGSNSNSSSMDPKSPPMSVLPLNIPEKSTTPVCQVLENVMTSAKSKVKISSSKSAPSKSTPTTTTTSTPEMKSYACGQCSKKFSRNQTLRSHELRQHSEQGHSHNSTPSSRAGVTTNGEKSGKIMVKDKSGKTRQADTITKPTFIPSNKSNKPEKARNKPGNLSTNKKSGVKKKTPTSKSQFSSGPSPPLMGGPPTSNHQTMTLPSCASLAQDLGFNTTPTFQQSQSQLNAYSHHLALSMLGAAQQLQNPCNLPLDSVVVSGHHLQHQQLASLQLINSHGQMGPSSSSSTLCPQTSSAFVINYPTIATMSFQNP